MGSIAYALAAGNTVVFKPSELTPGVGTWLADSVREVVPDHDLLQVVTGYGETGAALCRAGVDKISFTGSTATGKRVMGSCAESLTPVGIEAGGKDALLVDEDADLDAAADAAGWGAFANAGQTCAGVERVYVHEGDRFVQPTVLVDIPEDSEAVREETFGPTVTVRKVCDMEEAVQLANGGKDGLDSAIFTAKRGDDLAHRLRTGMTSINSVISFADVPTLPFGGVGDSGFGRIHGPDWLREFTYAKAVTRTGSRRRCTSPPSSEPRPRTRRSPPLLLALHGRATQLPKLPRRPLERIRGRRPTAPPDTSGTVKGFELSQTHAWLRSAPGDSLRRHSGRRMLQWTASNYMRA